MSVSGTPLAAFAGYLSLVSSILERIVLYGDRFMELAICAWRYFVIASQESRHGQGVFSNDFWKKNTNNGRLSELIPRISTQPRKTCGVLARHS